MEARFRVASLKPPPFFEKNKTRIFLLTSSALFLGSLLFPYWIFVMSAPTYPEKSLIIAVYADRLEGDIEEWRIVSRLVGVKVPPPVPELDLKIIPIMIVALSILSLVTAIKNRFAKIAMIASWVVIISLASWAQYRLYLIGHDLDETAPLRAYVKPFTPPLIGWITVAGRITVYHWPYMGSILFMVATLLITFVASLRFRNFIASLRLRLSQPKGT